MLTLVALAIAVTAVTGGAAFAQSHDTVDIEVVYRAGHREDIDGYAWRAIGEKAIEIAGATGERPIARADVQFVCPKKCPAALPSRPAAVDIIRWESGEETTGPVEVCGGVTDCSLAVFQNGAREDRGFRSVSYIQFGDAAPGGHGTAKGGVGAARFQ